MARFEKGDIVWFRAKAPLKRKAKIVDMTPFQVEIKLISSRNELKKVKKVM